MIKINDDFWNRYITLINDVVIPYQYAVMSDDIEVNIEKERDDAFIPSEKSHAINNLKIAAGLLEGNHYGWWFQDTDVYKWIESVAYTLNHRENSASESLVDEVIDIIVKAQDEDGYLSTFYQIEAPDMKYQALFQSHELYSAGHLIEAAIAYDKASGKDVLLDVAKKFVENIKNNFGIDKIDGTDGHQEIELALVKLYEHTQDESYLDLADYFINVRGQDPEFFQKQIDENVKQGRVGHRDVVNLKYLQGYAPVKDQVSMEGHAVRMLYMSSAMADLALHKKDTELYEASKTLWNNMVEKKMYVTGGVGSTVQGEAFTGDYDLPNDTMYCETCAAISVVYFAQRMFKLKQSSEYIDVLERALYNGVLSGMALDGKHFFYVNPLEVNPSNCETNPGKSHVKPVRPEWLGCACCPPNFARTVASIDQYIYHETDSTTFVNLFVESNADLKNFSLNLKSDYPNSGKVSISGNAVREDVRLAIRIPSWAKSFDVWLDGEPLETEVFDGYLYITPQQVSFTLDLKLDFSVRLIRAHDKVRDTAHKVSIQKGPFIYCMEGVDNGQQLHQIALDLNGAMRSEFIDDDLGKYNAIYAKGYRLHSSEQTRLYVYDSVIEGNSTEVRLIPYYMWGNRGLNEMIVWINRN